VPTRVTRPRVRWQGLTERAALSEFLAPLVGLVTDNIAAYGYWAVFFFMVLESACIPIPSELIMTFGGYLVGRGELTLSGVTIAGAAGNLVGSWLAYYAGKYGGRRFIERYGRFVFLSPKKLHSTERFFLRFGDPAVFMARLLPVIRTFISLPAGIGLMRPLHFSLYTFLGSLPWAFGLAYVGLVLGRNWDTVSAYFHRFDLALAVAALVLAAAYLLRSRSRRARPGSSAG